MYKGASQALVHRTAVDRPHPSRGFIDGGPDARDVLPDVAYMTFPAMVAEKQSLAHQLSRIQADIAAAKAAGQDRHAARLGQQHQTLQNRAAAINLRLKISTPTDKSTETLAAAVREICDPDLQARIFRRAREIHRKATGL